MSGQDSSSKAETRHAGYVDERGEMVWHPGPVESCWCRLFTAEGWVAFWAEEASDADA